MYNKQSIFLDHIFLQKKHLNFAGACSQKNTTLRRRRPPWRNFPCGKEQGVTAVFTGYITDNVAPKQFKGERVSQNLLLPYTTILLQCRNLKPVEICFHHCTYLPKIAKTITNQALDGPLQLQWSMTAFKVWT